MSRTVQHSSWAPVDDPRAIFVNTALWLPWRRDRAEGCPGLSELAELSRWQPFTAALLIAKTYGR